MSTNTPEERSADDIAAEDAVLDAMRIDAVEEAEKLHKLLDEWIRNPDFDQMVIALIGTRARLMCSSLFAVDHQAGVIAGTAAAEARAKKVEDIANQLAGPPATVQ